MKGLNGWQRLWVVFSVFTLGAGLLYLWTSSVHPYDASVGLQLDNEICQGMFTDAAFPPEVEAAREDGCYHLKIIKNVYGYGINSHEDYSDFRWQQLLKEFWNGLPFIVGAWLVLIATIYGLGKICAWVVAGFRKQAA